MSEFDKTEEEFLDQIEESLEQIDEISKDTLRSYVSKAKGSMGGHRKAADDIEIKHVNSGKDWSKGEYQSNPKWKKHFDKFHSRQAGLKKAVAKMKESYGEDMELELELLEDNAATIAGNPTDVSRSELMSMMVNYANSLGNKEELAAFVAKLPNAKTTQPDTPESRYASVADNATTDAGKNKASIKSSGAPGESMNTLPGVNNSRSPETLPSSVYSTSMKEDLAVLFGDDSGLSEDFRLKTETIFEAAVATRVGVELARLEESYEAKLEESVSAIQQEMEENVDAYLNYAVAEWMQENKLAIESNIRTEIMESFLGGLKDLFTEHHIDIPEDDVPVVEAMAAEIEALEEQINETTEKNIELQKALAEAEVLKAADELSEGMTDTQKDKFVKLVEAINYTSAEEFRKKASVIKETYFSGKTEVKAQQDQLLNETVEEPEAEKFVAPDMRMYVESLSRSIKK